jgi:4-amino-4-deoxychorismate lyase
MIKTLVNGKKQNSLNLNNRAIQYGDGLFETIAIIKGKPVLWDLHLARLQKSAEKLHIPAPSATLLYQEFQSLNAPIDKKKVLKIILSRGEGGRGYRMPPNPQPTRILSLMPYPDYPSVWKTEGIHCELSPIQLGLNPFFAGIKHLNRLEQVMARSEWNTPHIAEKVLCDIQGQVIEGTQTNLFIYTHNQLKTPLLSHCGVEGVMKAFILATATQLNIPYREEKISLADLTQAQGMFFSNSLIGVWAVKQFQQTQYQLSLLPIPLLSKIQDLFK